MWFIKKDYSVARTLLDRARNIPSTEAQREIERNYVVNALKDNGYPDSFINSTLPPNPQTSTQSDHKGFVVLPYIQGVSERIGRTLSRHGIENRIQAHNNNWLNLKETKT